MFVAPVEALVNRVMGELTIYGEIINAFLVSRHYFPSTPHQLL
jgi:hypothetical protein